MSFVGTGKPVPKLSDFAFCQGPIPGETQSQMFGYDKIIRSVSNKLSNFKLCVESHHNPDID